MNTEFGFLVCRVCTTPKVLLPKDVTLTSLFKDDGRGAKIFKFISGLDVSNDHVNVTKEITDFLAFTDFK